MMEQSTTTPDQVLNIANEHAGNAIQELPPQSSTLQRQQQAQSRRIKQYAVSTQWERQQSEGRGPKDFHSYCCCCAKRIGNMFALISKPDGTPIVMTGPCWPFCIFITFPLIVGISLLVIFVLILGDTFDLPNWLLGIYVPSVLVVLFFLFCVSCRNPGLMERVTDEEAGQGGWFWNEQVASFRPPGALYCRECGVLVQDYDHLCPWTGTSIGRDNMWAFKSFVVSVNVLCYMSIAILIWALLKGLAS